MTINNVETSLQAVGTAETIHMPVMLPEVLQALNIEDGKVYVDGTFGAGGYSRAILEQADCKVIAIDRDPNVKAQANKMTAEYTGRFSFIEGQFGDMKLLLTNNDIQKIDGIVLDIGVSSMQIDDGERGFSFQRDGALDMRMSNDGQSAADVVNMLEEEELANIIYKYGEERASRRVAHAIVDARSNKRIETTLELADIVRKAVKSSGKGKAKIDLATRTFQAIRIYVNDELGELENVLETAESLLMDGGRLVVVTFHSLEDRVVKKFMKSKSGKTVSGSRHQPVLLDEYKATAASLSPFEIVKPFPVLASESESLQNPRSRSAKLRTVKRLGNVS